MEGSVSSEKEASGESRQKAEGGRQEAGAEAEAEAGHVGGRAGSMQ